MKAYLILCILFASILFFPSSLLARELAVGGKGTPATGGANNPKQQPCNPSDRGESYCNGSKPPKSRTCKKFDRHCHSIP